MRPVLFCGVAWMKWYCGKRDDDVPRGGGGHAEKGEVENFKRRGRFLYGYVRAGPRAIIDITRLGAEPGKEYVDNVDVVWIAPSREGGRDVVGWYRDARVYRKLQRHRMKGRSRSCPYHVRAREGHCLEPHRRTFNIQYATKRSGGPGRGVWYADSPYGHKVTEGVRGLFNGDIPRMERPPIGTRRPKKMERKIVDISRDEKVHGYTLEQANGRCEYCRKDAPFKRPDGQPFLEIHHVKRLADGGQDVVCNAVALCPNCHREAHYGNSGVMQAKLKEVIRNRT